MRWSTSGIHTHRQRPNVPWAGYAYLLQAGFVRPVAAGIHDWGPLGVRVQQRFHHLVNELVCAEGTNGPVTVKCAPVRPAHETGPVTTLQEMTSPATWFTPALLHHAATSPPVQGTDTREYVTWNTVYRDEPRAHGLFRCRTFTLMEALALTADAEAAGKAHIRWLSTWRRLFTTLGVPVHQGTKEDAAGALAVVFLWPDTNADEIYFHCPRCHTWYHPEVAPYHREPPPTEPLHPLNEVATPECTTVEALCRYLNIPPSRVAKTMFLMAEGHATYPILAMVRGDREISYAKIRRIIGPVGLRPARPDEVRQLGAEPGYGSPLHVRQGLIVVDTTVAATPNLVAGANRPGYHVYNLNIGRDLMPHVIADIARAPEEATCPTCQRPFERRAAWPLASVTYPFQTHTRVLTPVPEFAQELEHLRSPLPEPPARDDQGKGTSPWFVRAALSLERVIAALVEGSHDDNGLIWPREVAPFDVHMVVIYPRRDEEAATVHQHATAVYTTLTQAGLSVLMDDRPVSAGVKFHDADLIGCPFRITVSARTVSQNAVEVKGRDGGSQLVPLDQLLESVM